MFYQQFISDGSIPVVLKSKLKNLLEGLLKHRLLCPISTASDSVGLEYF
jgi:hypothetical protein